MTERIAIMARFPRAGEVKTRLVPALGKEGACRVHRQMLERTLEVALQSGVPVELHLSEEVEPRQIRHLLPPDTQPEQFAVVAQARGNLGVRMGVAMARLQEQAQRAVVVGSDCPVLTPAYLHAAFRALDHNDFVLGPAEDGGYVLIGSRGEAFRNDPRMLETVATGTPGALGQTREILRGQGSSLACLETLWDLDDGDDYRRAVSQGYLADDGWSTVAADA